MPASTQRICSIALFGMLLSTSAGFVRPAESEAKKGTRYHQMKTKQRMEVLRAAHRPEFSFDQRLDRVTRGFLRTPYILSPLGEARGQDPDPRFRLDAFDCTTFVETAIALSQTHDWSQAADILDRLRYDNTKPHFDDRRHFITASWLKGLQGDGFLEDITPTLGGPYTEKITLKLSPNRWKKRRIAKGLKLPTKKIPFGTHTIQIIPISAFKKNTFKIPSGSLINVVRVPVRFAPIIVTHQGLYLVDEQGEPWIRHASPVAKRVIDEPFKNMLRRYNKPRKWPIAGFNFQKILTPAVDEASARQKDCE